MFTLDAEFWVAVAFVVFLGGLIYLGAHEMLVKFIDQRRDRIKAEVDEGLRAKGEAQPRLTQYQRKQREAEQEAAAIIAGATAEAERMMTEAKAKMEEFIARRSKMAETKIAQAEAQAVADGRAAAAEAAVGAAEKILADSPRCTLRDALLRRATARLRPRRN